MTDVCTDSKRQLQLTLHKTTIEGVALWDKCPEVTMAGGDGGEKCEWSSEKQCVSFRTTVRDQRSDRWLSTHLCHLSLNPTSLQGGHSFLSSGWTVKVNKTVT